ncbi:MAG TPA: hypothetical protein VFE47_18950 [Tepidisphaeraceae bacterium]|jgi:hypothetical protein|nr:hypothetical protein [Tepidisphaeraceae bacterium]
MTQEPHHQPPPVPPAPLGYQNGPIPAIPRTTYSARDTLIRFFAGLLLGAAVSAILWVGGWKYVTTGYSGLLILIVPAIKLIAGITLVCIRRWRAFGAGILVSIALGVLIFFGACVANFNSA